MPIGATFRGMMASSGVASASSYSYALFTWGMGTNGGLGVGDTTDRSVPIQVGVQTDWVSITGGNGGTSFAIKSNGSLFCWGENQAGQLGLGNTTGMSSPVQVGNLSNWSQSVAGHNSSLHIKTDGTLWAMGDGADGRTGLSDTVDRSSPTQIGSLTTWSQVSAVWKAAAAIKTDGTLWSWGFNGRGGLGDGTAVSKSSPVQVGSLTTWSSVSCGYNNKAAIKTDGTLWVCGGNTGGTLGLEDTVNRSSPVQVGSLTDWATILVGTWFMVATKTDGSIWSWGQGSGGTLGLEDTVNRSSPVQIGSLTNWGAMPITSKITGAAVTTNIKTDGTLWAWGNQYKGTLGDNSEIDKSSPVQIGGAADWFANVGADNSNGGIRKINNNAGYALWVWGEGGAGQLGQGNTTDTNSPIQVGTLNEWSFVNAGTGHTHAITTDGRLFAWGDATVYGRLGLGNTTDYSSPIQVGNLSDWYRISGGTSMKLALKTDGTIWSWGYDHHGALGQGTNIQHKSSPVKIGSLTNWASIDAGIAGSTHSAINTSGELFVWGRNNKGQIGDGTTITRSSPVQIGSQTDWSKTASDSNNIHGLKTTGKLYAWGDNSGGGGGQLGLGDTTNRSSPVQVGTLTTWSDIAASGSSMFGIRTNGTLWAWGNNTTYGMLGLGDTADRSSPVQVGSLTDWDSFATNMTGSNGFGGVKKTNGTLWFWGIGTSGQHGDRTATNKSSPVQVGGLSWHQLSTGQTHAAALRRPTIADGTTSGYLFTMGYQNGGQLGHNDTVDRSVPVQVGTDNDWAFISNGHYGTFGIKSSGKLYAWGQSGDGKLGLSDTVTRSSPVQVGSLTDWSKVYSAQLNTTGAIKTDNTLWTWGNNTTYGGLGHGDTTDRSSPVQVGSLTDWSDLAVSRGWMAAVKTDGTLWSWGRNTQGRLGLEDTVDRSSPVQIGSLTNWSNIEAGYWHAFAINTDGELFSWGDGGSGALGLGDTVDRSSPVQVGSLTTWSSLLSSINHTIALKTDGTLWAWGAGTQGGLGLGNTTSYSSPVQVGSLTDWATLSSGKDAGNNPLVIKTDGTIWTWGRNNKGQLGINNTTDYSSPVQIGHHNDFLSSTSDGTGMAAFIRKAYK